MRTRLPRTGENSSKRSKSELHQADEVVAALAVVQVLDVVMVHILVINGVKAMRLLILVQFIGFRGSHMPFVTRPITEHSAVGIPPIPPSIILQL
jgi:hypothetical protein